MLVISAVRGGAHFQKFSLVRQIRRPTGCVVIDDLVVVPHHQPRMGGVIGPQIRVQFVAGMVNAVIVQGVVARGLGEDMRMLAPTMHARQLGVINIVTHKQHQIQIGLGHLAMQGEMTCLVVLAGRQGHLQARRARSGVRRGAGATNRADVPCRNEPIEILPPRGQAFDIQVQGMRPLR